MRGRKLGVWFTFTLTTALAAPAGAQAPPPQPWAGAWQVVGGSGERHLDPDGPFVFFDLATDHGTASCRAPVAPERLELDGRIHRTVGLVGALEGRAPDDRPLEARGTIVRGRPTPQGEETAEAVFTLDGREVLRERWVRPGPAELAIVSLEGFGGGGLDPTRERVTVRVRVSGRAQRVTLTARVPEGDAEREAFYRREGLDPRRVARTEPVRLEPGEHTLEWDGRDGGPHARIALAGPWTLVVDSAERAARQPAPRPVTAQVAVPRPWLQCVQPRFSLGAGRFPDDVFERLRADFRAGYVQAPAVAPNERAALVDALRRAAVGVIATHGQPAQLSLGQQGRGHRWFTRADLPPGKPLEDVHAVFVFSCRTGARDPETDDDLPRALVAAGVDVVVSSTETLLIAEARPFYDAVSLRLLGYGHPIARAALDAAKFASEEVWDDLSDDARERLLADRRRIRPIRAALRVVAAPGVDPNQERLVPARYGRRRN